jgi:hypothetical protein
MSHLTQEFFWTPDELIEWLRRACKEFGLWLVVWRVGRNADRADPETLQLSMFDAAQDDSVQFFLGRSSLCPEPQWRVVGDRRELDFRRSYTVQLVPSVVGPDGNTLLQGSLAIMRATDYEDSSLAAELTRLFKQLKSDLKRNSDAGFIIIQTLPNGERKPWKNMLVGKAVPDTGMKLKQFVEGRVEFRVEPA